MSEPKYPRVHGVFKKHSVGRFLMTAWFYNPVAAQSGSMISGDGAEVVELIPLPEHQAIVAAAVAAERERCAGIAEGVEYYAVRHRETEPQAIRREIAQAIREVPE